MTMHIKKGGRKRSHAVMLGVRLGTVPVPRLKNETKNLPGIQMSRMDNNDKSIQKHLSFTGRLLDDLLVKHSKNLSSSLSHLTRIRSA
jgi:hypothetical protein